MSVPRLAALIALGLALGACESRGARRETTGRPVAPPEQPKRAGSVDRPAGPSEFRAATFNAGLAVGVLRHAEERAPLAVSALAGLDVEGLCVQEVWTEAHYRELESALHERLPHALRPPSRSETGAGSCSQREIGQVLACVRKECASSPSRVALCAATRCGHLSRGLSSGCLGCLMRDPGRSVGEVEAECGPAKASSPKQPVPSTRPPATGAHAYGGSYGIALFSRSPPLASDFLSFESRQLARGALYAKLAANGVARTLHVFCTHLTADIGGVPYDGAGGSWSAEHALQVGALLDWIDAKAPSGEPVLLLGDLNTGPAAGSAVRARLPAHYARFIASGFESPYLRAGPARCTFCSDNPVNGGAGNSGAVIDHALIRGFRGSSRAERVLDASIEIEKGARRVRTAYSDHYGVLVTLGSAPR
jgi:endonuclease/exonuclease/phosphatase family metal-dependent hydrolase